jgi:heat shock protein HslJ
MKMRKLFIGLSVAAFAVSCAVDKKPCDVKELEGKWEIVSVDTIENIRTERMPFIEMNMSELSFTGSASCNRIFGSLIVDSVASNKISFSVGMTRMMCADMTVERAVVDALSSVATFEFSNQDTSKVHFYNLQGTLMLTALRAKAEEEKSPEGLEGTWKILSVDGMSTATAESLTTLTFALETNTFLGNSGCNGIGGEFVMSDDSLSFNNVHVSQAMCSDESMAVEVKVLNAINNTRVWTIENKELHLKNADGESLAILCRE